RKGQVRRKFVALDRIAVLWEEHLDIGPEVKPYQILQQIHQSVDQDRTTLDLDRFRAAAADQSLHELDRKIAATQSELDLRPCPACVLFERCLGRQDSRPTKLLETMEDLAYHSQASGRDLWAEFLRHLEFLRKENFVNEQGML
ncbi:MAG: hypothetical protein HQK55_18615, partial [Deltaproteobacteria bacterium]|nr:hypothetical protein [Deltaproteobacteria bacterium]